ncbi:MAG: hypothetical protein ABJB47_06580 [Actinomycetota bacterium]
MAETALAYLAGLTRHRGQLPPRRTACPRWNGRSSSATGPAAARGGAPGQRRSDPARRRRRRAGLAELAGLASLAEEIHRRTAPPDTDDGGFADRSVRLSRTFAGRESLDGDLTQRVLPSWMPS